MEGYVDRLDDPTGVNESTLECARLDASRCDVVETQHAIARAHQAAVLAHIESSYAGAMG